jgi:hypothetical protein
LGIWVYDHWFPIHKTPHPHNQTKISKIQKLTLLRNLGLTKSKITFHLQPTLGKQARFFDRKSDFLELKNQGTLNENSFVLNSLSF